MTAGTDPHVQAVTDLLRPYSSHVHVSPFLDAGRWHVTAKATLRGNDVFAMTGAGDARRALYVAAEAAMSAVAEAGYVDAWAPRLEISGSISDPYGACRWVTVTGSLSLGLFVPTRPTLVREDRT